jgi:hypothetical protein
MMKAKINYTLLEDGLWESKVTILDKHGFVQAEVALCTINKVDRNILLGFRRHLLAIVRAENKRNVE